MIDRLGFDPNATSISVYKNFAENLLSLSVRNSSIAKTCRDLDINRQQFNKYLSGSVLPNEATLERIAKFFEIDALQLFMHPHSGVNITTKNTELVEKSKRNAALELALSDFKKRQLEFNLRAGVYFYYLPYEIDSSKCMRGIITIAVEDGVTFFTRVSRFDGVTSGQNYSRSNACDGLVTQARNKLMMLGRNRKYGQAISLLNVDTNNSIDEIYWFGLLTSYELTGLPIASQVILYHVGAIETWQLHFRLCGILKVDDSTIPNEIRGVIKHLFASGSATLHSIDVHRQQS